MEGKQFWCQMTGVVESVRFKGKEATITLKAHASNPGVRELLRELDTELVVEFRNPQLAMRLEVDEETGEVS